MIAHCRFICPLTQFDDFWLQIFGMTLLSFKIQFSILAIAYLDCFLLSGKSSLDVDRLLIAIQHAFHIPKMATLTLSGTVLGIDRQHAGGTRTCSNRRRPCFPFCHILFPEPYCPQPFLVSVTSAIKCPPSVVSPTRPRPSSRGSQGRGAQETGARPPRDIKRGNPSGLQVLVRMAAVRDHPTPYPGSAQESVRRMLAPCTLLPTVASTWPRVHHLYPPWSYRPIQQRVLRHRFFPVLPLSRDCTIQLPLRPPHCSTLGQTRMPFNLPIRTLADHHQIHPYRTLRYIVRSPFLQHRTTSRTRVE